MVITVHHLNNSRSQTILWLLEEMGVEYKIEHYKRLPQMWAPPELLKVNPVGKAPVITTEEGKNIAETGAIIEYLVRKYGKLGAPANDEDAWLKYTYWLHFSEGTAMAALVMKVIFDLIDEKSPFFIRPVAKLITGAVKKNFVAPNVEKQTNFMEAELGKNPQNWFVEDFSAADIMMSFPVITTELKVGLDGKPNLAKFLANIRTRPAYKTAIEKAGGEFKM